MIIADIIHSEPVIGDSMLIECGDTLIETVITDVLDDGVIVALDDTALGMLSEGLNLGGVASFFARHAGKEALSSIGYLVGVYLASGKNWNRIRAALGDERMAVLIAALDLLRDAPQWSNDSGFRAGAAEGSAAVDSHDSTLDGMIRVKLNRIKAAMDLLRENTDSADSVLDEAEYRGRKVPLNKPMAGDVKKSKVYVKKPDGTVVKVNFGDKKMRIKKSNPQRRKSFRARHRCDNPGPKWKARYWSCRAW